MPVNWNYKTLPLICLFILMFSKCQRNNRETDFKALINESWDLKGGERETFLKQSILLADSLNNEDGKIRTRYFLGFFYESSRKFEKADSVYNGLVYLTQQLNNTEWEVSALIQLGQIHIYQRKYDKAEAFLSQALDKSDFQPNQKLKGYTYSALGLLYERKADIGNAIVVYQQALEVFESSQDTAMQIKTLNYLGIQYSGLDLHDLSSSSYQTAAELALSKGDSAQYISSIYQSGINLIKNKEYAGALTLGHKALSLFDEKVDSAKYARILNNIGDAYLGLYETSQERLSFDSAYYFINESLRIKSKINDVKGRAFTLYNLGKLFSGTDPEKSEVYFMEAFEVWESDKNMLNLSKASIELAKLYSAKDRYRTTYYVNLADSLSLQLGNISQQATVMGLKASIASLSSDLVSYKRFIEKRDSLTELDGTRNRQRFVAATEVRLRTLELEKEKELLVETSALQENIARSRKLLLVITITFLIVVIAFLLYSLKKNKSLIRLNERIVNLKNGILHNQFNSFELLRAIFRIQEKEAKSSQDKSLLTQVNTKIGSLTGLSRILYKEQLKNYSGTEIINLKEYLESIVPDSMQLNDEELDYDLSVESIEVKSDTALSVGLIINEFCINYIKHALPSGASMMKVKLFELKGELYLHYNDDANLKDQVKKKENLYSKLVISLVQDLNGTTITDSSKGIEYRIVIPIKK